MSPLRVIDAEPLGESIVQRLEMALEKANAGELSSVAVAMAHRDGGVDWGWSDAPNVSLLIGGIERMKAALVRDADDE